MIKFRTALAVTAALIAAPALAQEAAPAPAPAPQTAAPAAPAAPVSDAEVKTFAKAAIAADKVNKDTTLAEADKARKLAEAVTTAGIQPDRFNQIATATGSDAALQKRIQDAIVAEQQANPSPPAAAATTTPAPAATSTPAPAPTPSR
jgi:hypothetical protein